MNGKWVFVIKRTKLKRNNRCRRRRFTEKNSNPQLYLPHELIIQILLRLPVKSLISFKCVCKSWFSLISDPHFANSHFQITAATPTRRILFTFTETRSVDSEASFDFDDSAPLNLDFLCPLFYSKLKIKGSCRGFILFHYYSNIYLWNPSTGVHKNIPLPRFGFDLYEVEHFHGFGYDESTDDYLLVSLSYDQIPYSDDMLSHLEIFSLRANAWEEIVGTTHLPHYREVSSSYDTVVESKFNGYPIVELNFNGAIHWMAFRYDLRVYVIVAFHLAEKKLLEIRLPVENDYDDRDCDLWVFKGFLSLWVLGNNTVDIWVMKEYNVQLSWTKILVLPIDTDHYISPICCTKRGDIIGTNGHTGLVKYNDKGEFIDYNSYGKDGRVFRLAVYTASLLSLPSANEQAQEDDTIKKNEVVGYSPSPFSGYL
jgi:F-box interacting protein